MTQAAEARLGKGDPAPPSALPSPWPLQLLPVYLLIAVLPVCIVLGGDLLLQKFSPAAPLFEATAGDISHQDGAARLNLMAAFLLVIGAGVAAAAFLANMVAKLDRRSTVRVGLALAAMVAVGALHYAFNSDYQMQEKLSGQLHCAAATAADAPKPNAVLKLKDFPEIGKQCDSGVHGFIRDVTEWESFVLGAAVPALVFGTICCLAVPGWASRPGSAAELELRRAAEVQLLNRQIGWLNTILYLSAALLVAGILFAGAYYHYPDFLLRGDAAMGFEKHAQALILYHAANHSLLIASFYVPAAAILGHRCSCLLTTDATQDAQAKFMAPMQLAKSGLAIFAPIIAGLIGDVLTLA